MPTTDGTVFQQSKVSEFALFRTLKNWRLKKKSSRKPQRLAGIIESRNSRCMYRGWLFGPKNYLAGFFRQAPGCIFCSQSFGWRKKAFPLNNPKWDHSLTALLATSQLFPQLSQRFRLSFNLVLHNILFARDFLGRPQNMRQIFSAGLKVSRKNSLLWSFWHLPNCWSRNTLEKMALEKHQSTFAHRLKFLAHFLRQKDAH